MTEAETSTGTPETSAIEKEIDKKTRVTILQWNIWHNADPDAILARLEKECEEDPEINVICLQEFDATRAEEFADRLGMQYKVSSQARHLEIAGRPYGKGDDLIILSNIPFNETSIRKKELSQDGWRFVKERKDIPSENYLEVTLNLPGNKELTVGNVHKLTPHLTKKAARKAEDEKLGVIAQGMAKKKAIIVGDYNADQESYAAEQMRKASFRSARDPGTTWTGKHWNRFIRPLVRHMQKEMDLAFVSEGVDVASSEIIADSRPSDHFMAKTRVLV